MYCIKIFHKFLFGIFLFLLIFFFSYSPTAYAITWPASYDTVVTDDFNDCSSYLQEEIHYGYADDKTHKFFTRMELEDLTIMDVGATYDFIFNASDFSAIWYKISLKKTGNPNDYDLKLKRSTNSGSDWTTLEEVLDTTFSGGEYDTGTLGARVTTGATGFVEVYAQKTYIQEYVSAVDMYYETRYDRAPDSNTSSYTLNTPIDQIAVTATSLAPADGIDQDTANIPVEQLSLQTNANTAEWTAITLNKTGTSTKDTDVEAVKIWLDDGDESFDSQTDTLISSGTDIFSDGTANITLTSAQTITTTAKVYFITFDVWWFADNDMTVRVRVADNSDLTVTSPDNVGPTNFPILSDAVNLNYVPYLSYTLSGVSLATATEGITTDITTTDSAMNFGEMDISVGNVIKEAAQTLTIATNSIYGYTIKVEQSQPLTSADNDIITSASATNAAPAAWPSGIATSCFGYHTSDDSLGTGTAGRFSADNTYAGLDTTPYEVAYNSVRTQEDIINMIYKIEVGPLQPAGKYYSHINYIVIPEY